jgi:hypothetical protein
MGGIRLLAVGKSLARLHAMSLPTIMALVSAALVSVRIEGRNIVHPCAVLTAAFAVAAGGLMSAAHAAATHPSFRPAPAASSGSCTFAKREYAAANSFDESTSETFVNLKDAGSITFSQNKIGCVAGTFFANAGTAAPGDHIGLQVLLDGAACAPLTNGYIFADAEFSSHSVAFFCGTGIAAGRHTIQIQYHSGFGGNVQFFQRTLQVDHT